MDQSKTPRRIPAVRGMATSYPKELMTLTSLPARRSTRIRPYLRAAEHQRAAHEAAFHLFAGLVVLLGLLRGGRR